MNSKIFLWLIPLIILNLTINYYFELRFQVTRVTDENLFVGNTEKILVTAVTSGGASDRAGMMVGDTIIAINGKTFKNSAHADAILRNNPPGSMMDYTIIRNGKEMTLHVQAATVGFSFVHITIIIFMICGFFLITWVGFKKPDHPGAQLFTLHWVCIIFFISTINFPANSGIYNSFRLSNIVLLFATNLHMVSYLFNRKPEELYAKFYYRSLYIISMLPPLIYIVFTFFISKEYIKALDSLYVLVIGLIIIFGIIGTYKLKGPESRVAKILGYSWAVFGVSIALAAILENVFGITESTYLFIAFLTIPAVHFYAISRYQLYEISILIRRNIQYTIFTFAYIFVLVFVFIVLLNLLTKENWLDLGVRFRTAMIEFAPIGTDGYSSGPIFAIWGILLFVGIYNLGKFGIQWLGGKFFREKIDYQFIFSELSVVVSQKMSIHDLSQAVVHEMRKWLKLKSMGLLINENNQLIENGFSSEENRDKDFKLTDELKQSLFSIVNPLPLQEWIGYEQTRSYQFQYIVPIILKGNLVGVLFMGEKLSEELYKKSDIIFSESFAKQLAVAIENTKLSEQAILNERLKRDLELAKNIQLNLLPKCIPNHPQLDICAYYKAAKDVGGDYYDFLPPNKNHLTGNISIIVGDVAGKGIPAAMFVTRVQGILHAAYQQLMDTPKKLFSHVNQLLSSENKKHFITLTAANFSIEEKKVKLIRAGHLSSILKRNSSIVRLTPRGIALGLDHTGIFEKELQVQEISYQENDFFIFISDGITEAMNSHDEEYGEERLEQIISSTQWTSADDMVNGIMNDVQQFCGQNELQDDATLVVVKIK